MIANERLMKIEEMKNRAEFASSLLTNILKKGKDVLCPALSRAEVEKSLSLSLSLSPHSKHFNGISLISRIFRSMRTQKF